MYPPRPWIFVVLLCLRPAVASIVGAHSAATAPSPVRPPAAARTVGTPNKEVRLRLGPMRVFGNAQPGGWRDRGFDDHAWTQVSGPVVPRVAVPSGATPPGGATAVDIAPGGSLFARLPFDAENLDAVRSLELRIAYQDGFVAYLNGRELTRRGISQSPAGARPRVAHGAEREIIYLPWPPTAPGGPSLRATDNVLALEVRPAMGRAPVDATAPSTELGLAAFSGVRIVRGPYLIVPGEGTVSIAWETDLPARGRVRFGPGGGTGAIAERQVRAPTAGLRQVVSLKGLRAGTRYRYQIDVDGVVSPESRAGTIDQAQSTPAFFQTAPRRDQPLRFIVYGDMRAPGHAAHAQVVAGLLREDPALVVNTGDLVAVGSDESAWQRYFEITAALGAIALVAPAVGNHEAYEGGAAKSWALFGLRTAAPTPGASYTSFDWGGAHFVILDTNHPDAAQRDWLTRDLANAARAHARAVFALCHDGPWSFGAHGGSRVMEQQFAPLLVTGGTDVLFSGHDHLYARGTGMTPRGGLAYVVTGGGGAPLYNPTCEPLSTPPGAIPPGAIPSPLPPCPPGVAIVRKTYHYIVVEVDDRKVRLCPRLPDGSAIEPCIDAPLRALERSGLQK